MYKTSDILITPEKGVIKGNGGIIEISIYGLPLKPGNYENTVVINCIGGGKNLKFPFKYEGKLIEFTSSLADLDSIPEVIIGSYYSQAFQITNECNALARCVFDLRSYPNLSIQLTSPEPVQPRSMQESRRKANAQDELVTQEFSRLCILNSSDDLYYFDNV